MFSAQHSKVFNQRGNKTWCSLSAFSIIEILSDDRETQLYSQSLTTLICIMHLPPDCIGSHLGWLCINRNNNQIIIIITNFPPLEKLSTQLVEKDKIFMCRSLGGNCIRFCLFGQRLHFSHSIKLPRRCIRYCWLVFVILEKK